MDENIKKYQKQCFWLLDNNDKSTENLKKTVESYNVDPKRLIYLRNLSYDEH